MADPAHSDPTTPAADAATGYATDQLDRLAGAVGGAFNASGLPHPSHIGDYRILGVLGEGGMGVVYRAEQQHPRRPVALKVIRPLLGGRGLLRRFRLEAETLGRLEHPGIARIYEAGTAQTDAGVQPFFAMEL